MSISRTFAAATLVAASVLIVASPARAAVELLSNPGFEAGVAGSPDATTGGDKPAVDNTTNPATLFGPWNGWNNWVSPFGPYYTSAVAHTGSQAGKTFSGPNAGMYQAVTIAGGADGRTYTASAWFDDRAADAMGPTTTADVRIIFQDASGNALAGGTFVSVPFAGATAPKDTWTQQTVTGIAPIGTGKVEVMAFYNNPNNEGGAMYVDDMSLTDTTPLPEPASLGLLSVGAAALLARRASAAPRRDDM